MPTASAEVVNVPVPVESSDAVRRLAVPSRNVTVPVGVPELALTVAVNVTISPNTVGFLDEAKFVAAPAVLTVNVAALDMAEPEGFVNTAR